METTKECILQILFGNALSYDEGIFGCVYFANSAFSKRYAGLVRANHCGLIMGHGGILRDAQLRHGRNIGQNVISVKACNIDISSSAGDIRARAPSSDNGPSSGFVLSLRYPKAHCQSLMLAASMT